MLLKLFKSRQFWTLIVLFILNGMEGVREFMPTEWLPYVNALLGILTVYFRVSPKQQF